MNAQETSQLIEETTQEMLEKLGLKAEIGLEQREEITWVILKTENPGLLIGYHGETLNAFEHLLKLIIHKKMGEWPTLTVDVADYRKNRERVLTGMAQGAAQRVKLANQVFKLPPLPAHERRVLHLVLAKEEGVVSESEGEGRERRVIVKPETESEVDQPAEQEVVSDETGDKKD